ncbi:hypothetical protein GCM10027028_64710 [Streptomyces sundarbansensis]
MVAPFAKVAWAILSLVSRFPRSGFLAADSPAPIRRLRRTSCARGEGAYTWCDHRCSFPAGPAGPARRAGRGGGTWGNQVTGLRESGFPEAVFLRAYMCGNSPPGAG